MVSSTGVCEHENGVGGQKAERQFGGKRVLLIHVWLGARMRGCKDARMRGGTPDQTKEGKEGQVHGGGWTFRLGSVSSSRLLVLGCVSGWVSPYHYEVLTTKKNTYLAFQATVPLDLFTFGSKRTEALGRWRRVGPDEWGF